MKTCAVIVFSMLILAGSLTARAAEPPTPRPPAPLMPPAQPVLPGMDTQLRPEVGESVDIYSGADGLKVSVLRYGPRRVSEALVQFSGIEDEGSGRIQRMQVKKTAQVSRYWINRNGKKVTLLTVNEDRSAQLYLPERADPLPANFDSELSGQSNAQLFLNEYLSVKR